jgi:hypothetical protein
MSTTTTTGIQSNETTCEHCGTPVTGSYTDDPEIRGVLVCSEACAREMAPLPYGASFIFSEPADE